MLTVKERTLIFFKKYKSPEASFVSGLFDVAGPDVTVFTRENFTEQMFAMLLEYDIILKASSGVDGAESGNNENWFIYSPAGEGLNEKQHLYQGCLRAQSEKHRCGNSQG
jgi:hypothetical protein